MDSFSFTPQNRQSTALSSERKESAAVYESDIGEHNRILLNSADSGFEDDNPVLSHYAEADKLGFSDTASLLLNSVIGGGIFSTPISVSCPWFLALEKDEMRIMDCDLATED
jgi:hypothetical protein